MSNKVKVVQRYETTDESLFESLSKAEAHQWFLDVGGWYKEGHMLRSQDGYPVDWVDLERWLVNNRVEVLNYYKGLEVS